MIGNHVKSSAVKVNGKKSTKAVLSALALQAVNVPKVEGVRAYLSKHADMFALVTKVAQAARALLQPATALSLENYHDPEFADEYLTLYVKQENYDENFWQKIETLRASYEAELAGLSGWLQVTADFRYLDALLLSAITEATKVIAILK